LTETLGSSKFCGVFPTVFDIVKSREKVSKMAVFTTFQTLLQIASIVAKGKCGPVGRTGRLHLHLRRNGNDSSFQANKTQTSTRTHVLEVRALFIFIVWPLLLIFPRALLDIPNFSIRKVTL
jgi:hypothetical protein